MYKKITILLLFAGAFFSGCTDVYKSIKGPVPEELKQNCGWERVSVSEIGTYEVVGSYEFGYKPRKTGTRVDGFRVYQKSPGDSVSSIGFCFNGTNYRLCRADGFFASLNKCLYIGDNAGVSLKEIDEFPRSVYDVCVAEFLARERFLMVCFKFTPFSFSYELLVFDEHLDIVYDEIFTGSSLTRVRLLRLSSGEEVIALDGKGGPGNLAGGGWFLRKRKE